MPDTATIPESEATLDDLRALGMELATGLQSDCQPPCIARAFARPERSALVLTMQGWIDLDATANPILNQFATESPEQFMDALAAFDQPVFDPILIEPEEAVAIVTRMIDAVKIAFSMGLKMVDPSSKGSGAHPDGFGSWLPVLACLITQCKMARVEALATPVCQAFGIISGMRRNQGWGEAGIPYALRGEV